MSTRETSNNKSQQIKTSFVCNGKLNSTCTGCFGGIESASGSKTTMKKYKQICDSAVTKDDEGIDILMLPLNETTIYVIRSSCHLFIKVIAVKNNRVITIANSITGTKPIYIEWCKVVKSQQENNSHGIEIFSCTRNESQAHYRMETETLHSTITWDKNYKNIKVITRQFRKCRSLSLLFSFGCDVVPLDRSYYLFLGGCNTRLLGCNKLGHLTSPHNMWFYGKMDNEGWWITYNQGGFIPTMGTVRCVVHRASDNTLYLAVTYDAYVEFWQINVISKRGFINLKPIKLFQQRWTNYRFQKPTFTALQINKNKNFLISSMINSDETQGNNMVIFLMLDLKTCQLHNLCPPKHCSSATMIRFSMPRFDPEYINFSFVRVVKDKVMMIDTTMMGLTWEQLRVILIGWYKNIHNEKCHIRTLPKDVLNQILLSYCGLITIQSPVLNYLHNN